MLKGVLANFGTEKKHVIITAVLLPYLPPTFLFSLVCLIYVPDFLLVPNNHYTQQRIQKMTATVMFYHLLLAMRTHETPLE